MYSYNPYYANYLAHFGIKRKSGRYPYGSGDRPYQHSPKKLKKIEKKLNKINNEKEFYENSLQTLNAMSNTTHGLTKILNDATIKTYTRALDKSNIRLDKMLSKVENYGLDTEINEIDKANIYTGNMFKGNKYTIVDTNSKKLNEFGDKLKPSQDSYGSNYTGSVNTKLANDVNIRISDNYKNDSSINRKEYVDNCKRIINNLDNINKKCVEEIAKQYYDDKAMYDSWNGDGKYANYTRDQFKTLMQKTFSSADINPERTLLWYMDGNKNPLQMYSDHSITVTFDTKTGKIDRDRIMLEG